MKTVPNFDWIGEENAFAVLARATALSQQGRDIINLGIGQPDFRTPDHIVEAAIKAMRDGHHGYTPATGIPQLREAETFLNEGYNVVSRAPAPTPADQTRLRLTAERLARLHDIWETIEPGAGHAALAAPWREKHQ